MAKTLRKKRFRKKSFHVKISISRRIDLAKKKKICHILFKDYNLSFFFIYLYTYLLHFLFSVSILIDFALSTYAAGGYPNAVFTAAVDLVIFGKDLFLAVSFDLNDPVGSLRATSDKSTDWYKEKMNQPDATDTDTNYYDNANPYVDFEMTGECRKTRESDLW